MATILNEIYSHLEPRCTVAFVKGLAMLLSHLPNGERAVVQRLSAAGAEVGDTTLRRLGELGFIPGEPVHMLCRGPGGREPLAVQVGETLFALRLVEAQCVEITLA
jgi:ferrous iron transport protein A